MEKFDTKEHARSSLTAVSRSKYPSNTTGEMKQRQLCELIFWISSSVYEHKKKDGNPERRLAFAAVRRAAEAGRANEKTDETNK